MSRYAVVAAVVSIVTAGSADGQIVVDTVPIGHAGNAADTRYPNGGVPSFGAVDYAYNIGTYEVTAGQYTAFLNAVAQSDTYGLYSPSMWLDAVGCKIQRSGSPGGHTYSVASDWADRPVNYVSWGDAARFSNWLHNGQPTGPQTLTTTEDGSYFLDGAAYNPALMAVTRGAGATWVIPSEDEWYKAAYHRNDGTTGNYWNYPTGTDSLPSNNLINPDPDNNANYHDVNDYTVGSPYYRTPAGEFENSESAYGTFDQGGNVAEWNEAASAGLYRVLRGGTYGDYAYAMRARERSRDSALFETFFIGFRVAQVPEPPVLLTLAIASLAFAGRRR